MKHRFASILSRCGFAICIACGLGILPSQAIPVGAQSTLSVPSQYPTIQSAINAAQNGDTIEVSPGTYHEQLSVWHKYINIQSTNGAGSTILEPGNGGPALVWQEVPFTGGYQGEFNGFTVEGGHSSQGGLAGGITLASGADVQLHNDVITGNSSSYPGGGIIVYQSDPVISNDTITSNSSSQEGGGVLIVDQSNPTLFQDTISNNSGNGGGGIWADSNSNPVLVEDTITGNYSPGTAGGLGMRLGVGGIVEDSTFSNNTAAYGGAIDLETAGGSPWILDNTFTNNAANVVSAGSGYGGAISVYNQSAPAIQGNTFQNNTAQGGGGAIVVAESANARIISNNFLNNSVPSSNLNGYGGGVYTSDATASLTNNCFMGNSSNSGGAIADVNGGVISSKNDSLLSNVETANLGSMPYAAGGIDVIPGATAFSANNDLLSGNGGAQIHDGMNSGGSATIGTYSSDDLYPASSNSSLFFYGSRNATTLSQITNPPVQESGLASFMASYTGDCVASSAPTSDYGMNDSAPADLTPIYRFYGLSTGFHFLTAVTAERDLTLQVQPLAWYDYEGIDFYAFNSQVSGTIPVWRFRSLTRAGDHFYTASAQEKDWIIANEPQGYAYEGVVFYVYPPDTANEYPVYRFLNNVNGSHFYTASTPEYQSLLNNADWTYEGVAFDIPEA